MFTGELFLSLVWFTIEKGVGIDCIMTNPSYSFNLCWLIWLLLSIVYASSILLNTLAKLIYCSGNLTSSQINS